MKIFKILSIVIFLAVILIAAGLAYFVNTFDANLYKKQIISLVNKQTGRELTIDGDLKLAVYPDIAIEMGNTTLSNAAGFAGDDFATIGSAQVSVEVLPLLKKVIKVDEVRLNGLKLNLHRKADGTTNWDDLAKGSDSKKGKKEESKSDKPAKVVEEMLNNLSVAGVSLKDADIHWRDDQSGQDIRLSPVNLKTGTFKQGKPLPVDLSLVMKQKNPATTIAAEATTTVTLSNNNQHFSLANLTLNSTITGAQVPNGALKTKLSGDVSGSPEKITIPNLSLRVELDGDLIPQGKVEADINGNVLFDVNAQLATIGGLKLDAKINGKPLDGGNLHALVTGDTRFDIAGQKLSIPNLAVDASLAGGFVKGGSASAKIKGNTQFDLAKQFLNISGLKLDANAKGELLQGGSANSHLSGDLAVDLANSHIKMPSITMNTQVEGGPVPGGKLSQQAQGSVDMNWASKQGGVNLSSLLVKLANLELTGSQVQLQPLAEKPAVTGQFKTNTFNLKEVLKTLGIDAPVTSNPKALSQLQAQFSLKANTENADLQALKMKLDKTSITGSLAVKNFTAPSIQPELSIDSINVDDYLAPSSKGGASAQAASSSSDNQELLPLETLRTLNIEGGF
ncbi:MAG TPA: AsmA family protein, partial [Thiothrix sp.]|nr:AsmA family protein [Thiothrix sp.]